MKIITMSIFLFGLMMGNAQADRSFLVDSDWLAENIEGDKTVVLEVRYEPHRYFTVGHIPGAIQVKRFKDLADNNSLTVTRFPSRKQFQKTLRRWGVQSDSTIVIYDDTRTVTASRLWVLLKLYGFSDSQLKILDGGTIGWATFEDMTTEISPARKPSNIVLKEADSSMFVRFPDVYDVITGPRDNETTLIDARPPERYAGSSSHGVQEGHIPGAINIVSMDGTDSASQTWLDEDTMKELYQSVSKDQSIIVYCDDGFRMSSAYLQLKSLGYKNVKLYDGGWSQWGNWLDLPTVKGDKPFDDTFSL